jgi:uncharacterized membrane protein
MSRDDAAKKSSFFRRAWGWIVLAAVAMFLALIFTPSIVNRWQWLTAAGSTANGAFGDQFGMTNALFSGLAFLALIITLFMQREELELQREELKDTRKVMEEQRDEFKQQVAAIRKQNFEATFFQLLRLQDQIRGAITIRNEHDPTVASTEGRQALTFAADALKRVLRNSPPTSPIETFLYRRIPLEMQQQLWGKATGERASVCERYEYLSKLRLDEPLGHYFRNLYVLLKFIHEADLKKDERDLYLRIYRAQLSQDEWMLVFYNATSAYGREKLLPLLEKHNLFQNFRRTNLADPSHRAWVSSLFADDPPIPGAPPASTP